MDYTGLIILESLINNAVLPHEIKTTKTEIWDVDNAVPGQPNRWTAVYFTVAKKSVNHVAQVLSELLQPKGWYLNISDADTMMVVFPHKVFKYSKGDVAKRQEVIAFGRTVGVPESQLDWGE
ncbi:MAG: hypothetical protein ACYC49_00125 [Ignavibacteriaceae bacterium]